MKKFLGLGVVLILLYAVLLAAIPASAVSAGPYNSSDNCIKSISMKETKSLESGKATYYRAVVNSSWHGLNKTYHDITSHLVIGSKDTQFFVYSGESSNKLGYAMNTVDNLVKAFEKENPAWKVVAAVNGDFFNTSTGEPEDPMIQDGDMLKSYMNTDNIGRGMVGMNYETGKLVYHTVGSNYKAKGYGTDLAGSYQVQVLGTHKTNAIASYDAALAIAPSLNKISFTTSDYGKGDYSGKTVYVVDLTKYRYDKGCHNKDQKSWTTFFAEGEIVEVKTGTKDMKPASGQAYIAVLSDKQAPLLKKGAYVKCQKVLTGEWVGVTNAIGFKQQLLAEGNLMFYNAYGRYHTNGDKGETLKWTEDIYDYPHCWKARTAIGFKADGTPVFMVIPYNKTLAATYYEMSCQFKALGCKNAFLLDGGGSSTMVIRSGSSFTTVCHAENGNDGEGRNIANIAIMAVRNPGVSLPIQDAVVDGGKETEKTTQKQTQKQTEKKTEKKTDAPVVDDATSVASESSTGAGSDEGGCKSAIIFPALLVTAGVSLVGFSKKRRK